MESDPAGLNVAWADLSETSAALPTPCP